MRTCPHCQMRYPTEAKFCFVDGKPLSEMSDSRLGTTIAGRYVLEEVIGRGGMAVVYRATHKLIERPCAVKILSAAIARDPKHVERFRREAKSAQQLSHPNIVEIFEFGETEDHAPYMVMELLRGSTLAKLIENGPLPIKRALPIMIQMSRAIARAHDLGVTHRDLKPENIFVGDRDDGHDLIKLLDFGIARRREDARLTGSGELFGTPEYMAPERITSGESGPSVDLYALGTIFFEMLTGRLPFEAKDLAVYFVKHVRETPPRLTEIVPAIPRQLEGWTLALLAKQPKDRPVDAHRVERDLIALAELEGAYLPPDPEKDPQSERLPARALPAVALHRWARRLAVFEQMVARAYGPTRPEDVSRMLGDLEALVGRVTELRTNAVAEQKKLEYIDQKGREARQRFGFAVDALGADASKARDDARGKASVAALRRQELELARERYLAAQKEVFFWEGRAGNEPVFELSRAYRQAADNVDLWMEANGALLSATSGYEDANRIVQDLDFQIRELRNALDAQEAKMETERVQTEQNMTEINTRAERLESQLFELAARFCEPLRERAELGAFFQQLEGEAAA